MHSTSSTPLGAALRGVVAGAAGTLAMDLALFASYRRGGGKSAFWNWESSAEVEQWDQAPAPAQVGRRVLEGLFLFELPDRQAPLVNNVTHWGYGALGGLEYGLVAGSLRTPRLWTGLPFGAAIWATSYVVLPAAKLYEPIWTYGKGVLAKDLSAHLVYGVVTAAVFQRLSAATRRHV